MELTWSDDGSKVESITDLGIDVTFHRFED